MKKTIMAVSALSCLLTYSSSYAQEEISNYDAIDQEKINGVYLKGFISPLTEHGRDEYNVGAGLGYKSGLFRVEGQYEYAHRVFSYVPTNSHSFNLMGYLDLDNKTIFSPYIGLGLEKNYTHTVSNDLIWYGLNPVASIGTRAYFNKNLALDIGYNTSLNALSSLKTNSDGFKLGLAYQF